MRRIVVIFVGLFIVLGMLFAGAHPVSARPQEQVGRPSLPDEQTHGTEHFVIHYTLTGSDAVEQTDTDDSGVPDYVETVGTLLEEMWVIQIDTMGWPHPPFDRGQGGDERIDIYLENILSDGYAGIVTTAGGFITDNPMTPQQERRAAYSYMTLDNDYAEADPYFGETPEGLMKATIAHEFNHVLQAGIDDLDQHYWLYESTATWIEDEVYDELNTSVYYLESVFKDPDVCLVSEWGNGEDLHWYGQWAFIQSLEERYGSEVVLAIWQNMRQLNGFGAIDAVLTEYGSSLEIETRDYAIANLLRAYRDGSLFPTVRVEGAATFGTYTPENGVQSLGVDYVRLVGSGGMAVTLDAEDARLTLTAVGVSGSEAQVIDAVDNQLIVQPDTYDETYLIIHNSQRIAAEEECWNVDYTLNVRQSEAAPTPLTSTWLAENYVSPQDAPVSVIEDGPENLLPPGAPFTGDTETSTDPGELNVSFQTLLPSYLPEGYEFDYAYILTEEDLGELWIYYVPGGGETANYDYLDAVGNWLSIAESPSPYNTVGEWIDDINYTDTPGEIIRVKGEDVLLEDLGVPGDPSFSATLILDGLFIVVDGDDTDTVVIELVEGLIDASESSSVVVEDPTNPAPSEPTTAPDVVPTTSPQRDVPAAPAQPDEQTGLMVLLGGLGVTACIAAACLLVLFPAAVVVLLRQYRKKK